MRRLANLLRLDCRRAEPEVVNTKLVLGLGVGAAILLVASRSATAPSESRAGGDLGYRALQAARTQVGVTESTGENDGAQIGRYFKGATRRSASGKEQPVPWSEELGWDWCAAFASWAAYAAKLAGESVPHGWRIAVWELVRDAKESGAWQDWQGVGEGPRPGSLVVYKRGDGDPRVAGQQGHVARVESWDGKSLRTIGGNESNSVKLQDNAHRMDKIVGLIHYT